MSQWQDLPKEWIFPHHVREAVTNYTQLSEEFARIQGLLAEAHPLLLLLYSGTPRNIRARTNIQNGVYVGAAASPQGAPTKVYRRTGEGVWMRHGAIVGTGGDLAFFANGVTDVDGTLVLVDKEAGWGVTPSPRGVLEIVDLDKDPHGGSRGGSMRDYHASTLSYLKQVDPAKDCTVFDLNWV